MRAAAARAAPHPRSGARAAFLGAVLVATPAVRPFRWSRLPWTYAVSLVPLVVLWDGFVSCLRTYTPGELAALSAGLGGDGWT